MFEEGDMFSTSEDVWRPECYLFIVDDEDELDED